MRRIDINQRLMHFQAQSIMKDSHEEEWQVFGVWWYFTFLLIFVILPVLMIVDEEQDWQLDLKIVLSPLALSWLGLVVTKILIHRVAVNYHQRVLGLHK
jgi:hypothetical protein